MKAIEKKYPFKFLEAYDKEDYNIFFGRDTEIDELYRGWINHGGNATLKSFGVTSLDQIPSYYIQFLENRRYYYLLDHHVLVHAGLNFRHTNPFLDIESMLWIKNFAVEAEKTFMLDREDCIKRADEAGLIIYAWRRRP